MRRSAIDSVQRGIANLVANWQLVLVQLLQTLLVSLLVVAGAAPFVLVIGVGTLRSLMGRDFMSAAGAPAVAEELLALLTEISGALLLATLVAGVVWTVALIVYSYFQAGIYGVLAEGDRIAGPSNDRLAFGAFSGRFFRAAADRRLWTFFWLINLFLLAGTLLALAVAVVAAFVVFQSMQEHAGIAAGIGCLGATAVAFVAVGCSLWWQLAMAVAVSGSSGLWRVTVDSLRVLLRRVGAVVVLMLLVIVVGMTVALVFVPLGIFVELVAADSLSAYVTAQVLMSLAQSVISSVLGIALAGALIALARGELDPERTLSA